MCQMPLVLHLYSPASLNGLTVQADFSVSRFPPLVADYNLVLIKVYNTTTLHLSFLLHVHCTLLVCRCTTLYHVYIFHLESWLWGSFHLSEG